MSVLDAVVAGTAHVIECRRCVASFAKMTEEERNAVRQVHLDGGDRIIPAARSHFREQNFGRGVVATSNTGLHGNFAQANHGAAELASRGDEITDMSTAKPAVDVPG